jgi:ABC-2 type transport system permease protein
MEFFSLRRARSIASKEVRHILRDKLLISFALGLPALLVVFFGYAIDFDVRDVKLAVFDADRTVSSRELVRVFESSGYFSIRGEASPSSVMDTLVSDRAGAGLIIERRFDSNKRSGRGAEAQILLDGSDNTIAGVVLSYLGGVEASAAGKRFEPVRVETRFLYNHELNSRWFIVPGLVVVVLSLLSVLLTALTIAREWENGSMELLLSTPVQPLEIIVGKIAPYMGLSLGGVFLVYLAARTVFGVPFVGSHFVLAVGSLLFLGSYLAQGIVISILTRKQQMAMQFAMISGLLPSMLLSGFIFPIESMPLFFRIFTAVFPARWFMAISRGVFLKGAGFGDLVGPFLALFVIVFVLITIATRKFKKDLEP